MKLFALFEVTNYDGNTLLGVYTSLEKAKEAQDQINARGEACDEFSYAVYELQADDEPQYEITWARAVS